MTQVTYSKKYSEKERKHFTVYGDCPVSDTAVFYEYWQLINTNADKNKAQIIDLINSYIPKAKSKIRIDTNSKEMEVYEIEFFRPNKYIFPQFYIRFK